MNPSSSGFYKRISIQSEDINVSIYLNDCSFVSFHNDFIITVLILIYQLMFLIKFNNSIYEKYLIDVLKQKTLPVTFCNNSKYFSQVEFNIQPKK